MFSLLTAINSSNAFAEETPNESQDSTSESSRERDRVLLKRSPITSEYQTLTAEVGVSFSSIYIYLLFL